MEAERPRPGAKTDAELDAELERLSQEAQAKLEAERAELAREAGRDRDAGAQLPRALTPEAEAAGGSLAGKLVVGALALVGLLVLWGLVIKPLLALALVLGVVALLGFGVWKLLELGGGDDEAGAA